MGTATLTSARHRGVRRDPLPSGSGYASLPAADYSSPPSASPSPVCEPVAIVSMAMVRSFQMAHPILMHIPPSPKSNVMPSRSHSLNGGSMDSGGFSRSAHPQSAMATDTEKAKRRRKALVVHGRVYSDDFMSMPNTVNSSSRHQQSFSV
ncbi:hypothetical protein CYLTODRAFT_421818 [Cylindrobasidium torrendii FP15055 ss-10]|uniref:Uncharacterized protein n=1 Tax=Cylindrobasidium torrendii FP15055 ss-10 TaxID=1314674 RepID=A0A0D7BCM0_9AGAR|nr:hypothetical protein CYLTODRAFT_421818 [Cylindrobasidium torrendii FP15055 ss-10]